MSNTLTHRLFAGWNLLAAGLLLVIAFSYFVPYNMDEFIHYDMITCHWYPGNDWDHKCDVWQLNFMNTGWIVPLRAFDYSGSFPALYYLPFHMLWNSPLMVRFLDLNILMLGGYIVARYAKLKPKYVIGGMLLCFPYLFQHLVDTGPVSFHILSVYLLATCFRRWCETLKTRFAVFSALLIFCGIWTKFAYFWLMPSLVILFFAEVWTHRATLFAPAARVRFLEQCAFAALILILPLIAILASTSPTNSAVHPYFDVLKNSESFTLSEMLHFVWWDREVWQAFLHPLLATQRVFILASNEPLSAAYRWVVFGFTPAAVVTALLVGVPWRRLLRPAGMYVLFGLVMFMVVRTKASWSMHHAVLSYSFLILSIASACRVFVEHPFRRCVRLRLRKIFALVALAFVCINLRFAYIGLTQRIWSASDMTRDITREVINDSDVHSRYVISILDWGLYYEQGLFGHRDQSIMFDSALKDPNRVDELKRIARDHGRKMMFVWSGSSADLDLLKTKFDLLRCAAIPEDAWWQILAEPDPSYENACQADLFQGDIFSSSSAMRRLAQVF